MLTDAELQAHADKIRDDGFSVLERAASPKATDARKMRAGEAVKP